MTSVSPTPKDTEAERREAMLEAAFQAAWTAYMRTPGSSHQSMIESWRNAVEAGVDAALAVLAASPAVTEGERAGEPYASIHAERLRAHAKHGAKSMEAQPWDDPIGKRLRILVEEVGEVAREFNDADIEGRPVDRAKLRSEVMQVSAMAVGWLAAIDGSALASPAVTAAEDETRGVL